MWFTDGNQAGLEFTNWISAESYFESGFQSTFIEKSNSPIFLKLLFYCFLFAFLKAPPRVYFKALSTWFLTTNHPFIAYFPLINENYLSLSPRLFIKVTYLNHTCPERAETSHVLLFTLKVERKHFWCTWL